MTSCNFKKLNMVGTTALIYKYHIDMIAARYSTLVPPCVQLNGYLNAATLLWYIPRKQACNLYSSCRSYIKTALPSHLSPSSSSFFQSSPSLSLPLFIHSLIHSFIHSVNLLTSTFIPSPTLFSVAFIDWSHHSSLFIFPISRRKKKKEKKNPP